MLNPVFRILFEIRGLVSSVLVLQKLSVGLRVYSPYWIRKELFFGKGNLKTQIGEGISYESAEPIFYER